MSRKLKKIVTLLSCHDFEMTLRIVTETLRQFWDNFETAVSSPSEHRPKPQPTPPRKSRINLQAYIFPRRILNIKIIRNELIEICAINSPKRFVHEGHWEVLDEGVGGSLTTHLQEM